MANVSLPSIFQDASAVASEEASRNAGLPGPSGGGARGPRHPKYNPRLAVIAQLALAKKKGRQIDLVADTDSVNVLKDKALYRAEREINLSHFRELMQIFERASKDGKKQLDMENFKRAFGAVLGKGLTEEQMGLLFMQVDANTDNAVDWEEFSTFMLLRAERQTKMREEASIQLFDVPSTMLSFPKLQTRHHEAIIAVIFVPGQNRFITCSREGTLCVWTESLKLQRCFTSICSRRRHLRDTIEDLKPQKEKKVNILRSPTPWAHDCVLMANLNKFAVASDDHEITFYEYSTLSPHIRLDLYDSVALSLHYWVNSENPDNDVASLFFSTDQGYVCEFTFSIAAVIAQKKRKGEAITISLVSPSSYHPASLSTAPLGALGGTLTRHKVHEDWAVKVRYYHELHSLVSCSPDPKASLVVAQRIATKPGGGGGRWSIFTAPVCKGVNTFAYSHFPVSLVTGGADRQLRVWNPHRLSHPMAALKGHNAPIIDISINDIDGQVISLSSDNMIKVWDLRTMQCLQSLLDRMPLESDVPLSRIFFNSSGKGKLLAVSNGIAEFKFKGKSDTQVTTSRTHEYPLRAALYNPNFRQIVTGCDGGVIQVWDALTGLKTFRFSEAHGKAEITAMGFDTGHRRLVTGARDGTIFVWNFHNGQLIRELVKPDSSEVTSIMYIEMNETQFIVATSWNKTVVIFEDDASAARIRPRAVYPNKKDPTPWHHEDVLCCDFCPPFLLATGSYDGQIAISNLQSGHLIHRLKWPGADDKSNPNRSIDKVLFLKERIMMKNAATLLTTGADGVIRWWQIDTAFLIWEMDATQGNGEGIYAMSVNSSNNLLVTGDSQGWVTVFDISLTCIDDRDEITPPNVLSVFRGHLKGIVSIDLMESSFMVTASTDGTARVFTARNNFLPNFSHNYGLGLWRLCGHAGPGLALGSFSSIYLLKSRKTFRRFSA
ncbi:WD40-repeat-containing domain protein [Zopfochytrium polystomum]|nr:WD40-repeat-containing domain protein [Zopfochytrium polystomum]